MAKHCCAYGCKVKSGAKFHSLPTCRKRARDWLKALNRLDILTDITEDRYNLLNFYHVCDAHFSKRDVTDLTPTLHVENRGTCTDHLCIDDASTSTDDLVMKILRNSTTDVIDIPPVMKRLSRSTVHIMDIPPVMKRLGRSTVDIIDIPPIPSVVKPAYYVPTDANTPGMERQNKHVPNIPYDVEPIGKTTDMGIPLVVPINTPGRGVIAAADNVWNPLNTPQTQPSGSLRNYRKIMPTIAVQKIQTNQDGVAKHASQGHTTIEINDFNECRPLIKTEANPLGLDDIFMALSEREKHSTVEAPVNLPNLTFKLKMNLPNIENSVANPKRSLENTEDDISAKLCKIEDEQS